jgi:hypothetical protein
MFFMRWVANFMPNPNLEDQVIPFSLGHHFWPVQNESYGTTGIALRVIWPFKPQHYF